MKRGLLSNSSQWRTCLIGAIAIGSWTVPGAVSFQGMASPTRPARPVARVETDLPTVTIAFKDVAESAGLNGVLVSGSEDRKTYILETTGTGVALLDYDNDGRLDIFMPNGTTFNPAEGGVSSEPPTGHLYRNLGGLKFEDVTNQAGLRRTGWGQGVCVGDYDNDGNRDLFVTYYGQSVLSRNRGDGTFADVTEAAGLRVPTARWDTGCSFVDYDLDGHLDLIVTSYLEFDRAKIPEPGAGGYCQWKGIPVMCGPRGLPFARNRLFHNDGKGRFMDDPRGAQDVQDRRPVESGARRAATPSPSSRRTSTTIVTPICTSPATRRQACCIETGRTVRSRTSGCSRAPP